MDIKWIRMDKYLKEIKRDIKWIRMHAQSARQSRQSGECDPDEILRDEDKAIAYGRNLQFETESMADSAIKHLEEIQMIATETADNRCMTKVSKSKEWIEDWLISILK